MKAATFFGHAVAPAVVRATPETHDGDRSLSGRLDDLRWLSLVADSPPVVLDELGLQCSGAEPCDADTAHWIA